MDAGHLPEPTMSGTSPASTRWPNTVVVTGLDNSQLRSLHFAHCRSRCRREISGALDADLLPAHCVGNGALVAADHRAMDTDHLGRHDLDAHDRPLLVQDHDERLSRLAGVATRWVEPRCRFALDLQFLPADRHGDHHFLLDHASPHAHPFGRAPYRVDSQLLLGAGHRLILIVIHTWVLPA